MSDCDFLLALLSDGEPRTTIEILNASFEQRECGLTVHSRAAELRKRGHVIVTNEVDSIGRRKVFTYQLLSPLREASPPSLGRDGGRDGDTTAGPLASRSGEAASGSRDADRPHGDSAPTQLFPTPEQPAWA